MGRTWDKAIGSMVKMNGKWCIDFTSSIFSQNFGHCNPFVMREVRKQLKKCNHAYGYDTEIKEKFIHELQMFTNYKNIILFSTGSEATEAAIKIAINNGYTCEGVRGSMHGRTFGAEALVGKRNHEQIRARDSITAPAIDCTGKTALFVEGYRGYDCRQITEEEQAYLREFKSYGNLVIFDEIQSGFYRTNNLFAHYNYMVRTPDILLIGKSVGGGFPISAVCYNKDFDLNGIELTATHSGQPLQMAAGYGVIKYIQKKFSFMEYTKRIEIANDFWDYLSELGIENNHLGMIGSFKCDEEEWIYSCCADKGLLVVTTHKGWIKIAPPVTTPLNKLQQGYSILKDIMLIHKENELWK